jgi:hypothetical protein
MAEKAKWEAWIATPPRETTPGNPESVYTRGGFQPAMSRLIGAHPRIAAKWGPLYSEIMFSPEGKLTRVEREMVAAVAAAAQDCHY